MNNLNFQTKFSNYANPSQDFILALANPTTELTDAIAKPSILRIDEPDVGESPQKGAPSQTASNVFRSMVLLDATQQKGAPFQVTSNVKIELIVGRAITYYFTYCF